MKKEIVSRKVTRRARNCSWKARKRAPSKKAQPGWYSHPHFLNMVKDIDEIDNMSLDHIIPLNSRVVCGLHCQGNWQLLSLKDNNKKDNKFLSDQIEELMMFDLHRQGRTDIIPKNYLNREIK